MNQSPPNNEEENMLTEFQNELLFQKTAFDYRIKRKNQNLSGLGPTSRDILYGSNKWKFNGERLKEILRNE